MLADFLRCWRLLGELQGASSAQSNFDKTFHRYARRVFCQSRCACGLGLVVLKFWQKKVLWNSSLLRARQLCLTRQSCSRDLHQAFPELHSDQFQRPWMTERKVKSQNNQFKSFNQSIETVCTTPTMGPSTLSVTFTNCAAQSGLSSSELSTAAIAGIAVGAFVLVAVVVAAVMGSIAHRRRNQKFASFLSGSGSGVYNKM